MAAPFNLTSIDSVDVSQTQFGPQMQAWLSNTVDKLNNDISLLNKAFANLIAVSGIDIGGGGAGPISVSVPGLSASGYVNVNLISSSNPVTISTVTAGTNAFTVTFSGDPGASAIIVYQAYTAQPQ